MSSGEDAIAITVLVATWREGGRREAGGGRGGGEESRRGGMN